MTRSLAHFALSAALVLPLLAITLAAERGQPDKIAARPLPTAGEAQILAALDQPTEFDFQECPLNDVIEHFKRKHEIGIQLNGKALANAGVGTDTPLTLTLKNITLRSALRLLWGPLALTCVVGDGYLLITSETEAETKLSVRVYPVEDLITPDSEFRAVPIPVNKGGDFGNLIDAITTTIRPETWDDVGGPASIVLNRQSQAIAVSQTDDVHEGIVSLLAALRCVRDEQIAAAKPDGSAATPKAPQKKGAFEVRAYRLMAVGGPAPKPPGKSGWRPPMGVVGDATPPREPQGTGKKPDAPIEPPRAQGAADKDAAAAADGKAPADKGAKPQRTDRNLEAWATAIAKLVPEMIESGSWEPSGEGTIRAVGEAVVVRHTEEVHRRVARLMAELLPECVPMDWAGPWGPWAALLPGQQAGPRLAPASTANWPHEAAPRPCDGEAYIEEILLKKCDIEFNELPLGEALNRLVGDVQLYIDHEALADAGVRTDTPVTRSIEGLSAKTALKLVLDELSLVCLIRNEVLVITSQTEAENTLTTKVYPVFDLVVRPPNAPPNRAGLDFTSLIDNLTCNISPMAWDEVGGPGAIQPFINSGALVVCQTSAVHEEIAKYLKALREVAAAQKH